MPRLIDVESRRQEIADATWRLVQRDGLDAVSVRNVAKEAGLSTGSLRHVFASQAELLTFAMEQLARRLGERLAALEPAASPRETAANALEHLLPLDEERRREGQVWIAFMARARVDAELRPLLELADDTMRALVSQALEPLAQADHELAVEEVYAVIDGLMLHAVLLPARTTPDAMTRVLRAHLARLVA